MHHGKFENKKKQKNKKKKKEQFLKTCLCFSNLTMDANVSLGKMEIIVKRR